MPGSAASPRRRRASRRATTMESTEIDVPLRSASDEEQLGRKQLRRARAARARAALPADVAPRARNAAAAHASLREGPSRRAHRHAAHAARQPAHGGDPIRLARRRRRLVRRRLVMLCDISGSMEPYARAYLQFLTCAAGSGPNAEAFVFATRLDAADPRPRLAQPGARDPARRRAAAPDWSSGTRIGDALREFNDRHGRRGMARGAVIVILSDGWERGDPMLVGREMERLSRLAHRIVWVNPRVSADAFSVQSGGMVAALPLLRCARQRPQLRGARRGRRRDRRGVRGTTVVAPRARRAPMERGAVGERNAGSRAARSGCRAGTARAGAT